jgi:hypothetical protein
MTGSEFNGHVPNQRIGAKRKRNSLAGRNKQDEREMQGMGQRRRLNGNDDNSQFK